MDREQRIKALAEEIRQLDKARRYELLHDLRSFVGLSRASQARLMGVTKDTARRTETGEPPYESDRVDRKNLVKLIRSLLSGGGSLPKVGEEQHGAGHSRVPVLHEIFALYQDRRSADLLELIEIYVATQGDGEKIREVARAMTLEADETGYQSARRRQTAALLEEVARRGEDNPKKRPGLAVDSP